MTRQLTRHNHYVPEWYQRAFLQAGEFKLHYLDLSPEQKILPDGRLVTMHHLSRRAPKGCFQEYDLYSTFFGTVINDEVEKFLFGSIDDRGAKSVRAFVSGSPSDMHHSFQDFFEFIDAEKLRTPKGLDWIKARYASLDQTQLMVEMQGLRFMHSTMWTEGVREIVSAENSDVKFIVSDHPVTAYNASVPPTTPDCAYPNDPPIEWIGTQTAFVLDPNTCLILTHLEYAQNPGANNLTTPRTHARYRGSSIVRTDAFIRTRKLSRDEVVAINFLLKSRARRYLAASTQDWLFPEKSFNGGWGDIASILLPKDELWRFGGDLYVGYKDGKSLHQDEFGRTSGAHEYLRRKNQRDDARPNDFCGCGSGLKFKRCCQKLTPDDRPTWEVYGIRERNLMLCHAVQDILGLNAGKTWQDVQRELSDDQVKRIHDAFASLWPEDTDLPSLLPRPKSDILRAVYLGMSDPRLMAPMVIGWLPYFDEVVLAHPFVNAVRIKPEYSPTFSPSQYKEQTLKNVLLLLSLEPFIRTGHVHLIPDPGDFDSQFGATMLEMARQRAEGWEAPKKLDAWQKVVTDDDFRRSILRMGEGSLRRSMRRAMPKASDSMIDAAVAYATSQLESDPYALLQPVEPGKAGGQLHVFKGYNLETSLFLASMTGSVIYTDNNTHWQQLHLHAQTTSQGQSVDWTPAIETLHDIEFPIELDPETILSALQARRFRAMRQELRPLADAILRQSSEPIPSQVASQLLNANERVKQAWANIPPYHRLAAGIQLSIPENGFERNEVRRLLVSFGRAKSVHPVPFAMLIKFEEVAPGPREDRPDEGASG